MRIWGLKPAVYQLSSESGLHKQVLMGRCDRSRHAHNLAINRQSYDTEEAIYKYVLRACVVHSKNTRTMCLSFCQLCWSCAEHKTFSAKFQARKSAD